MDKRQRQILGYQLDNEAAVIRELESQYRQTLKEIDFQIYHLQNMDQSPSKIYRTEYQKRLKMQVEASLEQLHATSYKSIDRFLQDSYETAFVGNMYVLHGQGVPVMVPVDHGAAIKAVSLDSKLREPLYRALGIDVDKLKKTISAQISRGIAAGRTYDEIANLINLTTAAPLNRAKTIVRTEGHRIQEAGAEDARQAAKAKGADIVKQWDATLDGATRKTHRQLDGQIRETNEPFEVNGKKAMFPGGFGDPAEDCNCRCCALTRARKALGAEELKQMQERAQFFGVDKTKDFEKFREKYLKAAETIEKAGKSGIINVGAKGALTSKNDPDNKKRQAHAKRYYEGIRNSDKESIVRTISKNTGFTVENVDTMISHVFFEKHDLDAGYSYFDSDYDMAESIRRLRTNDNIRAHDIILIQHEIKESELMKSGLPFEEAHEKAAELYNYAEALEKFHKENNLE